MALGYDLEKDITAIGDTAKLRAYLDTSAGQQLDPSDILSVVFNIQAPDGTRNTYQGIIEDDGAGILHYNDTILQGHYVAVATFSLADGTIRSTRDSFEVQDAFTEPLLYPTTPQDFIAQAVWGKLQDIFDSEDGGPWLREMTLRVFNPSRITDFISEAVLDFNLNNPVTNYTIADFTVSNDMIHNPNPMLPLIVEGTFLATLRHLMRSYVEQPLPQGGQVNYEDRRDYILRYKIVYDLELQMYARWVSMAKRSAFGFGRSALTTYSYSKGLWGGRFRYGRGFLGPGW